MSDNGELKIEKGIPLPNKKGISGSVSDVFKQMAIGDSIVFPAKNRSMMFYLQKTTGFRLTSRRINKDEVRIWRIA